MQLLAPSLGFPRHRCSRLVVNHKNDTAFGLAVSGPSLIKHRAVFIKPFQTDVHFDLRKQGKNMKFTQSHIDDYFDRINLPLGERQKFKDPAGGTEPGSQLQSLTTLLHHHLAAVPFENTSLHYSRHRPIELSIRSLFQKIVYRRRGGHCTQVNTLFSELLLALGYHLYTTAARVNHAASATSVGKERQGSRFGTL